MTVPKDLFVDAGGARLAVRDYGGSGIPLLLLHGHFGNLGQFDQLGPLLAEHMRVVAYDQRGQGWSEDGAVSVEAWAEDTAAVVAALGLERPVVYGSSFGTLAGLGYALAGGAVRAFVSEDGRARDFGEPTTSPPPTKLRPVLTADESAAYVAGYAAFGVAGEGTARRSLVLRPDGTHEVRPTPETICNKEQAFARLPVLDAYRAVRGPVLMLAAEHGNEPPETRRTELAALAEVVDADVRWFSTGHWISAADPDGVVTAVSDFVRQTVSSAVGDNRT